MVMFLTTALYQDSIVIIFSLLLDLPKSFILCFYFFLYASEENIGITKVFYLYFLMDLYILDCPKHDLIIFEKYLHVTPILWLC